jgi:hypothetical protein
MPGKATPKFGDQVDELVGNIQKKLYGREGGEHVRGKNRRGAGVGLRPHVRS